MKTEKPTKAEMHDPSAPLGGGADGHLKLEGSLGPQHCRTIANYALELVSRLLSEEAAQHGGSVRAQDIDRIIKAVHATPPALWDIYRNSFGLCAADLKDSPSHEYVRHDYFFRLIIGTFSHRFPDKVLEGDTFPTLPRNIIKPFDLTLKVLLGEDFMSQSRETCSQVVDEMHQKYGHSFTWQAFYDDERSIRILVTTCAAIARHFKNFENRKTWFLGALNANLDHSVHNRSGEKGVVEFTERDFNLLFSHLFEAYHRSVERLGGKKWLDSILSAADVAVIEELLGKLEPLE